jgi:excisionase family DNA binding protein
MDNLRRNAEKHAAISAIAPPSIESLWTPKDVASYLRVSVRKVERMRSAGAMPSPDFFLGRLPRYRPDSIREWLDSMKGATK